MNGFPFAWESYTRMLHTRQPWACHTTALGQQQREQPLHAHHTGTVTVNTVSQDAYFSMQMAAASIKTTAAHSSVSF